MAELHVVTGLVAKRAELAGQIEQYRRELDRLVVNMGHLDGSIKLFTPDYKLEGIRSKVPRQRNRFFRQGECQRLLMEVFRMHKPLSPHVKLPKPWQNVRDWRLIRQRSNRCANMRGV